MPKNIVIFSDGTGQEGGKNHNTNIYKMFNMVEDRTPDQIAFYDRGIGTGMNVLRNVVAAGTGRGFGHNVRDCYRFIFEKYESGDRLFLLGFSRGAATVRALSYFIHLFGVLPHARPELIPEAWRIYKIRDRGRREEEAKRFVERHHTIWTRVHFLGCYDAVAALGAPWKRLSATLDQIPLFHHRFHSFTLSPSVEAAYQALAIDDERLTFHPLLWAPQRLPYQTIHQVWFAGVHTDVGGGYPEQALSDIPLVWMTRKATEHGLRIYPKRELPIGEAIDGVMHDSRAGSWRRLYRRRVRTWPDETHGRPTIHASVLQRQTGRDNRSPYRPWILEGRTPEDYVVEPWVSHSDVPLQTARQRPEQVPGVRIVGEQGPEAAAAVPANPG